MSHTINHAHTLFIKRINFIFNANAFCIHTFCARQNVRLNWRANFSHLHLWRFSMSVRRSFSHTLSPCNIALTFVFSLSNIKEAFHQRGGRMQLQRAVEMGDEMHDQLPIVSVCVLADKNRCPPGFTTVNHTHTVVKASN